MIRIVLVVLAGLLVCSPGVAQTACTFTLNPTSANIAAAGGTATITVTASASTCDRTAASNADWITITAGASGKGSGTVSYTATANTFPTVRTGSLTIGDKTFTVTQQGASCNFSINPTNATVPAAGGSGSVALTTTCSWTANPSADWITLTSAASGTGNASIDYQVSANPNATQRSATIQIGSLNFTITQTASCATTLNPSSISLPYTATTGTIAVTSTVSTCDRSATSNASWITISSGATGTGNGTVGYSVAANNSPQDRIGTINIGSATFTIQQAASTACTYSVSPQNATVAAAGGTGLFTITTVCTWTVSSNNDWLSTTQTSGSGNATITYQATANTGTDSRSGSFNIGSNTTFVVNQPGIPCTVTLGTPGATLQAAGDTGTFDVLAPQGCVWKATTTATWLTITTQQGNGSGNVTFTAAANPTRQMRSTTIAVNNRLFNVQQSGADCDQRLNPRSDTVAAEGGSGTISVTTACNYTVAATAPWISVTSGATGPPGDSVVTYSVPPNNSANPRTGGISISGDIVTLTQAGKSCAVTLGSASGSVEGNGGTGRFNVASGSNCAWTPVSSTSWLKIASWSNAGGNGMVSYSAERNPGNDGRSGTISVGDQTFTVNQGGAVVALSPNGIVSSASFLGGSIAPGEVVSIFGSGLGPERLMSAALSIDSTAFPAEIGQVRVWFDEFAAPLLFVSEGQVSAIVPYEAAGRANVNVAVEYTGVRSNAVSTKVAATAPSIFTATGRGTGQGSILNQDYKPNSAANPAARNQFVLVYLTGAGLMDPALPSGAITGTTLQKPVAGVTAQINGIDAPVLYAGSVPGLVSGVLQLNVRVPANAPVGNAVPLVVRIGGVASQAGVTLAIR